MGTEPLRLPAGEPRELRATDPAGEAEEVLDLRRVRRLPTGHVALEHDGPQAVGRGVDGRRQARRTGADDREVVVARRRRLGMAP